VSAEHAASVALRASVDELLARGPTTLPAQPQGDER